MTTTLIPAYGRDYKTAQAAKAAWDAGKDWQIANMFHPDDGRYTSKADWAGETVLLRFCRLTKITQAKGPRK